MCAGEVVDSEMPILRLEISAEFRLSKFAELRLNEVSAHVSALPIHVGVLLPVGV